MYKYNSKHAKPVIRFLRVSDRTRNHPFYESDFQRRSPCSFQSYCHFCFLEDLVAGVYRIYCEVAAIDSVKKACLRLEKDVPGVSTTVDVDRMEVEQLYQVERGELDEPHETAPRSRRSLIAFLFK